MEKGSRDDKFSIIQEYKIYTKLIWIYSRTKVIKVKLSLKYQMVFKTNLLAPALCTRQTNFFNLGWAISLG